MTGINDFRYIDFDFMIIGMIQQSKRLKKLIPHYDSYDSSFLTFKGDDHLATYLLNSGRRHEFFNKFRILVCEHYQGLTPEEFSRVFIPGIIRFFKNNKELIVIGLTKTHFVDIEVSERSSILNFGRSQYNLKSERDSTSEHYGLAEDIESRENFFLESLTSIFKQAVLLRFNEPKENIIRYFRIYLTKGYIDVATNREDNEFIKALVREKKENQTLLTRQIRPSQILNLTKSFYKSSCGESHELEMKNIHHIIRPVGDLSLRSSNDF